MNRSRLTFTDRSRFLQFSFSGRCSIMATLTVLLIMSFAVQASEMVVRINIESDTRERIGEIVASGVDVLARGGDWVDVRIPSTFLSTLQVEGLNTQVRIADTESYEQELRDRAYFDHFHDYDEIVAEIQEVAEQFPDIVQIHDIGDSWEKTEGIADRDIFALKISDQVAIQDPMEPEVLIMVGLHAREIITPEIAMHLIHFLTDNYGTDPRVTDMVNERQIWIIPTCNPDGLEFVHHEDIWWRKNRRDNEDGSFGVDLNRNWGYAWGYDDVGSSPNSWSSTYRGAAPFSEPELQSIRDFCESHTFIISLSYHSYGNWWLYPWGYIPEFTPDHPIFEAIGDSCTAYNGYEPGNAATGTIYPTNGDSDDWLYGEQTTKHKIFAFTPEVGGGQDGFHPDTTRIQTLILENLEPNLFVIEAAAYYAPRPIIEHEPLNDTEDTSGPYHVSAVITVPLWPLDESSLLLHYRWDVENFTTIPLTAGLLPNSYEAWIDGPGMPGTCEYYLSAADSLGRGTVAPPDAPDELYDFTVGPDEVPPMFSDLTQLPSMLHIPFEEPRTVTVTVSDNIGVDVESGLLHYRAGSDAGTIEMEMLEGTREGTVLTALLGPVGTYGDTVYYWCQVSDLAVAPNTGFSSMLYYVYGLEEFETGIHLWDPGSGWGLQETAGAHSGQWIATDSPSGPYDNDTDDALTLIPGLNLSQWEATHVGFWAKWALEDNEDFVYLEASKDGVAWESFYALTGRELAWTYHEASLEGYAGSGSDSVRIRFRLVSDEEGNDSGIFLDDVLVSQRSTVPAIPHGVLPNEPWLTGWPNPSRGVVQFSVHGKEGASEIRLFDLAGRMVKSLPLLSGQRSIQWDGTDVRGHDLPSGVYHARLSTGSVTLKVVMIK